MKVTLDDARRLLADPKLAVAFCDALVADRTKALGLLDEALTPEQVAQKVVEIRGEVRGILLVKSVFVEAAAFVKRAAENEEQVARSAREHILPRVAAAAFMEPARDGEERT